MAFPFSESELLYMQQHRDEDRGPAIKVYLLVSIILSIIAVVLRLYSRLYMRLAILFDDYLMVIGAVLNIISTGLLYKLITLGGGKHVLFVKSDNIRTLTKFVLPMGVTFDFGVHFLKASALALYLRIFPSQSFRRIVYVGLVLVFAQGFSLGIVFLFQCTPIRKTWDPSVPGHCVNIYAVAMALTIANIVTDTLIFLLPVIPIARLRVSKEKKFFLLSAFSLGSGVMFVSIYRTTMINLFSSPDITYNAIKLFTVINAEGFGAIIFLNIPVVFPLIRGQLSGMRSSVSKSASRPSISAKPTGASLGSKGEGDFIELVQDIHVSYSERRNSDRITGKYGGELGGGGWSGDRETA